jgi:hypothetical protein
LSFDPAPAREEVAGDLDHGASVPPFGPAGTPKIDPDEQFWCAERASGCPVAVWVVPPS